MHNEPQFRTATPRVVRLELADLYVGGDTAAVQLDGIPCDAWAQALAEALAQDPALAGVSATLDGRWVHFSGVRKSGGPLAPRLLGAVATAGELAYAPRLTRPARRPLRRLAAAALQC